MLGVPELTIWYVAALEVAHFGLSASAGFLGYWLTSTILSRITSWDTGHLPLSASSTSRLPLLAALSFSVLAHVSEDYWVKWF